jgi:hypothetical protein
MKILLLSIFFAVISLFSLHSRVAAQTSTPIPTFTPIPPSPTPTLQPEERITILEGQIQDINEKLENPQKDIWDIISVVSTCIGAIAGASLAGVGLFAADVYRRRQEATETARAIQHHELMQIQTLQSFMQHLRSQDQTEVEAALLAISELGNDKLAMGFATLYQSEGAISALIKIASEEKSNRASLARVALERITTPYKPFLPSVVQIINKNTSKIMGTGFIITAEGIIVTTDYAVKDLDEYDLITATGHRSALVHRRRLNHGLALLNFHQNPDNQPEIYTPLSIQHQFKPLSITDEVFILGSDGRSGMPIATSARVHEINANLTHFPGTQFVILKVKLSSREFRGAPVLNRSYNVVGVVIEMHSSNDISKFDLAYIITNDLINSSLQAQVT